MSVDLIAGGALLQAGALERFSAEGGRVSCGVRASAEGALCSLYESACEFAQIEPSKLEPFVARLLDVLLDCLHHGAWPVRDGSVLILLLLRAYSQAF